MTTVTLIIALVLLGQKPMQLTIPMESVDACLAEATLFMHFNQAPDKPGIVMRGVQCMEKTDGKDVKDAPPSEPPH
jgi:hypothetical protein